jgi:lysophospholipase L1-like esterase
VNINSRGYRGDEVELEKNKKRILVLGDSFTFGLFVKDDETYSAVLQKILADHGYDYEVINAGYADGWEADEQYSWLVNEGISLQPDLVIYGLFVGNDIDKIDKSSWKQVDTYGLPIQIKSDILYVDETLGIIRDRSPSAWYYRIPVLRNWHLFVLFGRATTKLASMSSSGDWRVFSSSERFAPNLIRRKDGYEYQLYMDEFRKKESNFLRLVKGMERVSREKNAKFLVLMLPWNFMVEPDYFFPNFRINPEKYELKDYYHELANKLEIMGINHLNIQKEMKSNPAKKYFPRDGETHLNPAGHEFTASRLYQFLSSNNLVVH